MSERLKQSLTAAGQSDIFDVGIGLFTVTVSGDMVDLVMNLQRSFNYDSADPGSATWHNTDAISGAISINATSVEEKTAWRFDLVSITSGTATVRVGNNSVGRGV